MIISNFNDHIACGFSNKIMGVVSAKYVAPLKVELHFNDGIIKTVDVGAFIRKHPHPQYNSYLNENKFKKFKIEFGNIVWGKNWDLIFPLDKLYAGSLLLNKKRVCYKSIIQCLLPHLTKGLYATMNRWRIDP